MKMRGELPSVDIATMPELAHLVEEVETSGKRRRLTRHGRDVAVLLPARPPMRRRQRVSRTITRVGDEDEMVVAEPARRRRQSLSVTEMTAGALKEYRLPRPLTPEEENEAFERAMAEEASGDTSS